MNFKMNTGINRPLEFYGIQAQYISYMGLGCLGLLLFFAVLYLAGVNSYFAMAVVLPAGGCMVLMAKRLSARFGPDGLIKWAARRHMPYRITPSELEERLPAMGSTEDIIVGRSGDITVAFRIDLPEIHSLTRAQFDALHAIWNRCIGLMPSNTIVHRQDRYCVGVNAPVATGDTSFLSSASNRHFFERPALIHDGYLFFTLRADGRPPATSAATNLFRSDLVPPVTMDSDRVKAFLDKVDQAVRILEETGHVHIRRLGASEYDRQMHQYAYLGTGAVAGDIVLEDGLRIGGRYSRLYTLVSPEAMPSECGSWAPHATYSANRSVIPIGLTSVVGPLLDVDHIYNQYIVIGDKAKMIANLERRRRRFQSLSKFSRQNAASAEALEAFLKEAAGGQRTLVRAHFNVLVHGESQEALREASTRTAAAFAQMGAIPKVESVGAPQIWAAGIPGNAGDLPDNECFDTFAEQAVCFLIHEAPSPFVVGEGGLRLGDRLSGAAVRVDLSDEPVRRGIIGNRAKLILGGSGSGKSFFTNHYVRTCYEQGAHVVVVDVGHSYKGLCELVEGQYFAFSKTQPPAFNPFQVQGGGAPDFEQLESIKALLLALWKREDEQPPRLEYAALSDALRLYFDYLQKHPYLEPCFNTFYEFLKEEFATRLKQQKVTDHDFNLNNFLYVLAPFYSGGEYDRLLNAREQPDLLDQRFIVFELEAVKDHPVLYPVVTIILMETFLAKTRKLEGVRKIFLIEEAWKPVTRPGMATFIQTVFKTIRKKNGEPIVVTQEVDDLLSSPIIKQTIINNTDTKILLDQSSFQSRAEEISQLLGLSEAEQALVRSLNKANEPGKRYKEVFISLGGRIAKVYRVEVSPEEYLCYTTEETEKVRVQESARRHGSMKAGIRALLAMLLLCLTVTQSHAQVPVLGIVQTILKKVITSLDIKVQQLQLQSLNLQCAQKETENALSQGKLAEIVAWLQQEEDLYSAYYAELWQVKPVLYGCTPIRVIQDRDQKVAQSCRQAMALFAQDGHFSDAEMGHITAVLDGFLDASAQNLDRLTLLITDGSTQMSDGRRLGLIDEAARQSEDELDQLQTFTNAQELLSLHRARTLQDLQSVQRLYGLN